MPPFYSPTHEKAPPSRLTLVWGGCLRSGQRLTSNHQWATSRPNSAGRGGFLSNRFGIRLLQVLTGTRAPWQRPQRIASGPSPTRAPGPQLPSPEASRGLRISFVTAGRMSRQVFLVPQPATRDERWRPCTLQRVVAREWQIATTQFPFPCLRE